MITKEQLMENVEKLIGRWGNKDKVLMTENIDDCKIRFYTNDHCYTIYAKYPKDNEKGYLGCIANTRKPLAGEDWNRGNDLHDGGFDQDTWDKIVYDMFAFELVPIAKREAPVIDEALKGE